MFGPVDALSRPNHIQLCTLIPHSSTPVHRSVVNLTFLHLDETAVRCVEDLWSVVIVVAGGRMTGFQARLYAVIDEPQFKRNSTQMRAESFHYRGNCAHGVTPRYIP